MLFDTNLIQWMLKTPKNFDKNYSCFRKQETKKGHSVLRGKNAQS